MQYGYSYNRGYSRDDRTEKPQVIASGFAVQATDDEVKDVVRHELSKFGDIITVLLKGRDKDRTAYITFTDDEPARELRRYCLERHCKVIAFQRALHFEFDLGDYLRSDNVRGGYGKRVFERSGYRDRFDSRNHYGRDHDYGDAGSRDKSDSSINPRATRTLFVGNLDVNITKEVLLRIFERWGAIDDIDIKRPSNGTSVYAFIKYLELEAAAAAKNQMFGEEINGRPCKVGYGKTMPSPRLWIGGLGIWCTRELLNREFDRFGAIKNIEYTKGSRHAFILFESLDAASAAHAEMRGFPLGGQDHKIKIDYAEAAGNRHRGDNDNRSRSDNHSPTSSARDSRGRSSQSYGCGREQDDSYHRRSRHSRDERRRTHSRSPLSDDRRDLRNHIHSAENHVSSPEYVHSNRKDIRADIRQTNGQTVAEADSSRRVANLFDVAKIFDVAWIGALALKSSAFPVRMHLIGGSQELCNYFLHGVGMGAGVPPKVLNVTQRLRLDQPKLDEVSRRVSQVGTNGHCVLLALSTGDDFDLDSSYAKRPLKSLVTYFKKKEAAGVIMLNSDQGSKPEDGGMLHAFPPCDFSHQYLLKAVHNLGPGPSNEDHLVIIIVRGSSG